MPSVIHQSSSLISSYQTAFFDVVDGYIYTPVINNSVIDHQSSTISHAISHQSLLQWYDLPAFTPMILIINHLYVSHLPSVMSSVIIHQWLISLVRSTRLHPDDINHQSSVCQSSAISHVISHHSSVANITGTIYPPSPRCPPHPPDTTGLCVSPPPVPAVPLPLLWESWQRVLEVSPTVESWQRVLEVSPTVESRQRVLAGQGRAHGHGGQVHGSLLLG